MARKIQLFPLSVEVQEGTTFDSNSREFIIDILKFRGTGLTAQMVIDRQRLIDKFHNLDANAQDVYLWERDYVVLLEATNAYHFVVVAPDLAKFAKSILEAEGVLEEDANETA